MRILAAADIHGSQYRLNLVLQNIEKHRPDLVVICGDITQFGPGERATNFLNQIPGRIFAVPGNIDSDDVNEAISKSNATNLHLRRIVFQGIPFIGIGRDLPSSFDKVLITDENQKKLLPELVDETSVLVTHVPPYKLQDTIFLGTHGGNKALRQVVDSRHPRLVLCAHIHENPGVSISGKTTVVNCSMGKRTEGAVVDIDKTIKVSILE
jgi:Icc-related predicted phosphoesterase